jgi:tetratricopeptide (TPR) repeat protein
MPSLGLAMIVKDAAGTLRDCLASVAGLTDQIVIADTGSSDGTVQLARALGAQVFDSPWQDNFAQARNSAVKALTTDWVLVMDDDEELDPEARPRILTLLDNATVGGYLVTLRNHIPVKFGSGGHAASIKSNDSTMPRAERALAYADFAICRLFRRHPEIHYVGRVHEHVEPSIRALGLKLRSANLIIHHFGHLRSPAELHSKNEFYRELGRLKVKDVPNDPEAWVELGLQEYEQFRNYSAGIECFKKALTLNPHSSVPALSLANLYVEIQADALALQLLSGIAMTGRAAGEKEHIYGDAFYNLGRLKEARAAYLRALGILPEDTRVVSKLGLTEVRLGLKKNGLARLTRALKATPDVIELHDRIIKAYILMNLLPQAAEAAEHLAIGLPNPTTILRAASIRAQLKESKAVEEIISRGLQLFPQNQELLQAQAELRQDTTRHAEPLECNANSTPGEQDAFQANCPPHRPLPTAYCTTGLWEEKSLSRP